MNGSLLLIKKKKKSSQKYVSGGKLLGPSHEKCGIQIEVEGGEYIIKKDSVNKDTLPILEEINRTGSYVWPTIDARKRNKGGK